MKKTILLSILATALICTSMSIYSQTTQPWAPIGAEWYYGCVTWQEYPSYTHYEVTKDTLINGKLCSLLQSKAKNEYMYEEKQKVYYYFQDSFHVIYDFSAKVGDTVLISFKTKTDAKEDSVVPRYCLIDSINTIFNNGISLRKSYTTILDTAPWNYATMQYNYIERIGNEQDLIYIVGVPYVPEAVPKLRCYNDSQISYKTELWIRSGKPCDYDANTSIYQNMVEHNFSVMLSELDKMIKFYCKQSFGTQKHSFQIIDLQGRIVLHGRFACEETRDVSNLKQGVYFVKILAPKYALVETHKIIIK